MVSHSLYKQVELSWFVYQNLNAHLINLRNLVSHNYIFKFHYCSYFNLFGICLHANGSWKRTDRFSNFILHTHTHTHTHTYNYFILGTPVVRMRKEVEEMIKCRGGFIMTDYKSTQVRHINETNATLWYLDIHVR